MKHINRFFENTDDSFISDLTNFCEENLVYLIDYGLRISVEKLRSSHSYTADTQNNRSTHYHGGYSFQLRNYKNPSIIRLDFFNVKDSYWSELKDTIISFLMRLKQVYNISEFIHSNKTNQIEVITKDYSSLYYNFDDIINHKNLAPGFTFDYFDIGTIFIIVDGYKDSSIEVKEPKKVSLKKYFMNTLKRFNENLSHDEINDLKDLCDAHFAYLYDEGYIVNVENKVDEFGHDGRVKIPYTHIDFRKGNESSDAFTWSDIKDYFIPFAENLYSEYPLAVITFRKKENYARFNLGWVYKEYHIEDIVADTIKQDLKIREISIRI